MQNKHAYTIFAMETSNSAKFIVKKVIFHLTFVTIFGNFESGLQFEDTCQQSIHCFQLK